MRGEPTMEVTHDPALNLAYVRFRSREATEAVRTLVFADDLNVDLTADGSVYGVEFLDAAKQMRFLDGGPLVLLHVESGGYVTLPFPEELP